MRLPGDSRSGQITQFQKVRAGSSLRLPPVRSGLAGLRKQTLSETAVSEVLIPQ